MSLAWPRPCGGHESVGERGVGGGTDAVVAVVVVQEEAEVL